MPDENSLTGPVPADDLPVEVMQFIRERIESVPHLEALILLIAEPKAIWTAQRLAQRIYVGEHEARRILRKLTRHRLIEISGDGYVLNKGGQWSAALMADVVTAYQHNISRIATFIHQQRSRSVREFARAFDLKKEREP